MFLPHCQTIIKHAGYYNFFVYLQSLRKDGRVAEGAGLENRYTLHGVSGVRIPLLPQRIQNSTATQTAVLFHFLPPPSPLPSFLSPLSSFLSPLLLPPIKFLSQESLHIPTVLLSLLPCFPSLPLLLYPFIFPSPHPIPIPSQMVQKMGHLRRKRPKTSQVVQNMGHL